eukprot:GHVS01083209.1.p1 GENE.GHVS01083209.1~~GHVS01083209.1.p1  ORF type:complete len:296 (-),score=68.25 GHVS01083209.1:98-985(-)
MEISDVFAEITRLRQQLDCSLADYAAVADYTVADYAAAGGRKCDIDRRSHVALSQRISALLNLYNKCVTQFQLEIPKLRYEQTLWKRRLAKVLDDADSLNKDFSKQLGHICAVDKRKELMLDNKTSHQRTAMLSYASENDSLKASHGMIDSITEQGRRIVEQVGKQNISLKGARRKVLDISSSVGVSSTLLGVISRRHSIDKCVVYLCMIATIVILVGLYSYTHHHHQYSNDVKQQHKTQTTTTRNSHEPLTHHVVNNNKQTNTQDNVEATTDQTDNNNNNSGGGMTSTVGGDGG